MTYIYALCDPDTDEPRYIGKADDPEKRFEWHLKDEHPHNHKVAWIQSLLHRDKSPKLVVYAEVPDDVWRECERFMIASLKQMGYRLTNMTDGGEGGAMCEDARCRMAAKLVGNKHTAGRKLSEETRAKMRGPRGTLSQETRYRMSLANRGENNNAGTILTADDVREIRRKYAAGGITQAQLAEEYGLSHQAVVSRIILRKDWKWLN